MGTLVLINGQPVASDQARVSVFDRGFLYGDSVFETLRTYQGRVFAVQQHLERLRHSAELVHIEVGANDRDLVDELERGVALAKNEESYLRLMVTRGSGDLSLAPDAILTPTRVLIVAPLRPLERSAYEIGVSAVTYRTRRAVDATDAVGAKIGNYLVAVLAMRVARQAGANEALVVNADGRIIEGATSNVFVVRGGRLTTPPETAGILAGITRALLLELAKDQGFRVEFESPSIEQTYAADEVMLTSSIREIVPVISVDGQAIGRSVPGPVYQQLRAAFTQHVQAT